MPTFWWDGHPNFGDDVGPLLLPHYGIVPQHSEPAHASLVGVGSILEFLPSGFTGAIWGSGLIADAPHPLPRATVLAVRGPLTAERLGLTEEPPYGDPAILIARHLPRPVGDGRIAVVPHGHHRGHDRLAALVRMADGAARMVNVHQRAAPAIREIATARVVLTTSLHGLIAADAYGIPAVWTTLDPPLHGGDFKFRDYEAAVTPGSTRYRAFDEGLSLDELTAHAQTVSPQRLRTLGDGLEEAIAAAGSLDGVPFPQGIRHALHRR